MNNFGAGRPLPAPTVECDLKGTTMADLQRKPNGTSGKVHDITPQTANCATDVTQSLRFVGGFLA